MVQLEIYRYGITYQRNIEEGYMTQQVKYRKNHSSTDRAKMFRMASVVRAISIPASEIIARDKKHRRQQAG